MNGQHPSLADAGAGRPIDPAAGAHTVAGLAAVLFFVGLGSLGLTDRDEGRNAEAGREMYETGNYISPTFNYEPRFAKPVFVYWLMSLSYHVVRGERIRRAIPVGPLRSRTDPAPIPLSDTLPGAGDGPLRRGDAVAEP